jgi:hypothetical protein
MKKKKTRCYLAGPMRGIPYFNFPAFFAAEKKLKEKGYTVFNPARRDVQKYGKEIAAPDGSVKTAAAQVGFSLREALAMDSQWLCLNADAIALLPGWKKSKGANAELALAKALDLKVIKLKKGKKR